MLTRLTTIAVLALALAACGDDDPAGPKPATGAAAAPALAKQPQRQGEILVSGEAGPEEHGPYTFDGRYRVRFEQRAPEDPRLDFTQQTPFSASLVQRGDQTDDRTRRLFEEAARSGERTIEIRGRWIVSVEFGDFPYAVRFTRTAASG